MPFESKAQKSEISAFLSGFVNAMGTLEIKRQPRLSLFPVH